MLVGSGLLEHREQVVTGDRHQTGVRLQSYIRFRGFRQG
jgi:hypothetical protein